MRSDLAVVYVRLKKKIFATAALICRGDQRCALGSGAASRCRGVCAAPRKVFLERAKRDDRGSM